MPAALPVALRERAMTRLEAGESPFVVARELEVSRMTVYRWLAPPVAAAAAPARTRQRKSKLEPQEALAHPKDTVEELRERLHLQVSLSTVLRALHAAGIRHKRAHFRDLRTRTDPGI
jgi:transposase